MGGGDVVCGSVAGEGEREADRRRLPIVAADVVLGGAPAGAESDHLEGDKSLTTEIVSSRSKHARFYASLLWSGLVHVAEAVDGPDARGGGSRFSFQPQPGDVSLHVHHPGRQAGSLDMTIFERAGL